ncbi:hypothetical protein APHAL10511_007863 [Amanita phalloides]|nr:hypothetical protein APHAL10511_007863 [Amanita phalloides]
MSYLTDAVFDSWDTLEEAKDSYLYAEFKAAIIALYPGAEPSRKYTREDMIELVNKWQQAGIKTTNILATISKSSKTSPTILFQLGE